MIAQDGITKLELATYLRDVGAAFLRRVSGRPMTLQRFPTGINGEEFYSKNPAEGSPSRRANRDDSLPSRREHPQLGVEEIATAVWAVRMNTVTFHPWPVRAADTPHALDQPNKVPGIDLDPQPGRGLRDAVEAAYLLREVLTSARADRLPQRPWATRGVHVLPIAPRREFLDVHGVIAITRELEQLGPTSSRRRSRRGTHGERVFMGSEQACRDRTIAAAYSPRPLPGAPVSMPGVLGRARRGRGP